MAYTDILLTIGGFVVGLAAGLYLIGQRQVDERTILAKAEKIRADSEKQMKEIRGSAHERVVHAKKQFEIEYQEFASQLEKMDKMYETKNISYKKREAKITEMQRVLAEEQGAVKSIRVRLDELNKEISERLIVLTGVSHNRIKEELVAKYESDFKNDADLRIARQFEWDSESAVREGRNILAQAMYRFTDGTSVEHDRREIKVVHDEVKGRIVGRGGKLITFFEELFKVDVIFNDEPNTIIVSCFNLVQQEIARVALERLMREKVISEEVITRAKALAEEDVDKLLRTEGEAALNVLELKNMPPDFAKLVGRLKFRTSYGQNIMRHCFEVGYFARLIASEVGANIEVAFLGGFFHDIGKAIDQEVGGSHDVLSKEILEKYGFSWEITHAAWTHHNAIPQETIEARIVQAADAISAGRPGARAESVERYLAKIKDLQETALSFAGVKKAFAINAGREVRLILDPDKVRDTDVPALAEQVAAKVQEKGGYPGKIKVVTVRTTKATDYAR